MNKDLRWPGPNSPSLIFFVSNKALTNWLIFVHICLYKKKQTQNRDKFIKTIEKLLISIFFSDIYFLSFFSDMFA